VVIQTNKCRQPAPCANVADAFIADRETVDADGTIEIDVDAASASYRVSYATATLMFAVKAPARADVLATPP
jgi:hypothetical protein